MIKAPLKYTAKSIAAEQNLLNDLEFEWIRQFYIQGAKHKELHIWWHAPMDELINFWKQLECRLKKAVSILQDASGKVFRIYLKFTFYICSAPTYDFEQMVSV